MLRTCGLSSSELDLLQRIPDDDVARQAALERMIGEHVDALLVAQEKSREFQSRTRYFTEEGHWRDIDYLVTILLFAVITWHADHLIVRSGFRCSLRRSCCP